MRKWIKRCEVGFVKYLGGGDITDICMRVCMELLKDLAKRLWFTDVLV
jgi:hypothetical protein